jgi:dTDP-4-dehydrorhamnose 3,5-epimerase
LDPALALPWPDADLSLVVSPKDEAAPTLAEAEAAGLLPHFDDCRRWYHKLDAAG